MRGIRLSREGEELSSVHPAGDGIRLVKGQVMLLNAHEVLMLRDFLISQYPDAQIPDGPMP